MYFHFDLTSKSRFSITFLPEARWVVFSNPKNEVWVDRILNFDVVIVYVKDLGIVGVPGQFVLFKIFTERERGNGITDIHILCDCFNI